MLRLSLATIQVKECEVWQLPHSMEVGLDQPKSPKLPTLSYICLGRLGSLGLVNLSLMLKSNGIS